MRRYIWPAISVLIIFSSNYASAQDNYFRDHLGDKAWRHESFVTSQEIALSPKELELPSLLSSRRIITEMRPRSYLFPGVSYKSADLPFGYSVDVLGQQIEDRMEAPLNPSGLSVWENWLTTANELRSGGEHDLKRLVRSSNGNENPLRYQAEDGINFFYGVASRILGLSSTEANIMAGATAIVWYGMNRKILPYGGLWSIDMGDDPTGAIHSRLGQEYYDSGQYMYDFFIQRGVYPNGLSLDSLLYEALRTEEWEEAEKMLKQRPPTDEISRRISDTRLQRQAIARAAVTGQSAQQALRKMQIAAVAEEARRSKEIEDKKIADRVIKEERDKIEKAANEEREKIKREDEEKKRKELDRIAKQAIADAEKRRQEDEAKRKELRETELRQNAEQNDRINQAERDKPSSKPSYSHGGGGGSTNQSGSQGQQSIPLNKP